ncbi:protein kintoun [Harpegnathos saltator]|uniref:Protein kintoun n=1 Tax=Harpegnathos saltator TaxID=610380 RepID=E2C131_HARSA|nr:protein kintoun [Harpegnathos saltator]EFN78352.1 PIH1 domain-containing protein 1 [Harpegnathos saltator]
MDVFESRRKAWEDLDVSRDELQNITECLKKEDFRKLLIEYAEEVRDPDNRRTYEKEITQLEKERGVDVTFVNPEPGYVIKTSVNGERKCFLNISKNDVVARPTSQPSYEQGHRGLHWSIPYTLIPPRDDLDKKNVRCVVFDVVFHPDTIYLASKNARFREIVNNTAMDGVENNFKVKLDRKNLKFPKISFKGVSHPTVIRRPSEEPPKEPLDMDSEIYQKLTTSYDESRERCLKTKEEVPQRVAPVSTYYKNKQQQALDEKYVTPKFTVKHQSNVEMEDFCLGKDAKLYAAIPKKLVVTVDLPLLKSANDATLDIHERSLTLKSEKPAKYLLDLPLPYPVDGDSGNAKFDAKYKKLIVTLPVIRSLVPTIDTKVDSGVDSDQSSPISKDVGKENVPDNKAELIKKCESIHEAEELDQTSEAIRKCANTVLRTSDTTGTADAFMNSSVKYNLPAYTCNIYNNQLAITVNVKNVNPDVICHKILENNAGLHVLLTSVGAGFFPQHYSLCLKIGDHSVEPESLAIEPWDNNVVFSITVRDIENVKQYSAGLDTEFMEEKDLPTAASFRSKFQELMASSENESLTKREVSIAPRGDSVIIDIRPTQQDSDDEEEHGNVRIIAAQGQEEARIAEKSRSVSESSGDELANSNNSTRHSKGILKSRRVRDFSRSVSESSADENSLPASCTDYHYDSVQDINSESDCSSLKKTVRFNDVVSRQLFRSNSSILGQRKKNQRKLRNKKRAHERRMSESENSETEERGKYNKTPHHKHSPSEEASSDAVKPILTRDRQSGQQRTANIEIAKLNTNDQHPLQHKRKSNVDEKPSPTEEEEEEEEEEAQEVSDAPGTDTKDDIVQLEFKNDLIFDLDM